MGHTYSANLVHCVFSTKDRQAAIPPELQDKLWAYVIGTAEHLGIRLLATGGTHLVYTFATHWGGL